ncbi:MAG: LPS biosynthesis glycosyltransferase [Leptolyngbya sp. IPPAS B-1204]
MHTQLDAPPMHKLFNQPQPKLATAIGQTFILAYRESTHVLEQTLTEAGLSCGVLRQADRPEYQDYASIYRCLLNHQQAWMQAAHAQQPTLIVEADFVPVIGFGELPLPFNLSQPDVGICWLYTCAPQLYSVTQEGFGEGYSTGLVAYIVTPKAAQLLCQFVTEITQAHGTGYYNFDSYIDCYLRQHQLKNYIAFRNYGEHGGKPNPEHRRNGMSGIHRADVLYGELAFLPPYAQASKHPLLCLLLVRLRARLKGIGRLLLGKFLRLQVLRRSTVPWRLLGFALRRQLYVYREF